MAWLEKMQAEFGVPIEYVVAIIGVETYYGRYAGNYRVIDALSTLAFDYPARSPFFTKELEHFLLLSKEQKLKPAELKGSYAGAMGYGQFMPSSYRAYVTTMMAWPISGLTLPMPLAVLPTTLSAMAGSPVRAWWSGRE